MNFLQECASDLDSGSSAQTVLSKMRTRYTTPVCMKVKTCLVRKMCKPDPTFVDALNTILVEDVQCDDRERIKKRVMECVTSSRRKSNETLVDEILKKLPDYLPKNVRQLHITPSEIRECKKNSRISRLSKNQSKTRVNGVKLLEQARSDVISAVYISDLAFALMLLTGRRQCEILSGNASFVAVEGNPYAAEFTGQAKRKGGVDSPHVYTIPLLETYDIILNAYLKLRDLQERAILTKDQTSRKYQSLLSRRLVSRCDYFSDVGHPHGLRGVYACMALRAFTWGTMSDSFVTMCILGHRDLDESLVYTTFDVGEDFTNVYGKTLGNGELTCCVQLT
ncbi:MAG: hypothetical protein CBC12_07400 [Candidatus Puniceispirillum sp. TMED52]|jgi:integrase|nr:MAG: hypothetical protein CBC12_07400 [Candidatus Puniceispirillum sp. TMED52]RPF82025.1 MAG: hypothetical protein CBC65_001440 [Rhodothermaceae bacterium TMED105]